MKLSVIVPVFNEKKSIREILGRIDRVSIPKEILVVDDGSTDGTTGLLREIEKTSEFPSVRFIFTDKNRGKGAALRTGIQQATGDIVLIQDADLEYDPAEYARLIEPIMSGKADVVYGSRFLSGPHRVLFFWHFAGNRFLTLLSNMLTNLNLTDMETGYKVFRREVFTKISIEENRFGFEPEITAKIAKLKCRIYEVPIAYYGRDYSEGKKITWKDGVAALNCIFKYNLFRSPRAHFVAKVFWLLLLVAIASANIFQLTHLWEPSLEITRDEVSNYEQRLERLRPFLPKSGPVGYLAEAHLSDSNTDIEVVKKYYLTQYALVPLVIRPGTEDELIIANLPDAATASDRTAGLVLVEDFGDGLILFRRKAE